MTTAAPDLAANIRALRKRKKLSLNELARRTGIAASNLSSMELGKSSPTLSTLAKIAAAFDMKAGALLDEVLYSKVFLCRSGEGYPVPETAQDVSVRLLSVDLHLTRMESRIVTMKAYRESYVPPGRGSDRFVYCLSGAVSVMVDDETYGLEAGDSLYVFPEARVSFSHNGNGEAMFLLVRARGGEE